MQYCKKTLNGPKKIRDHIKAIAYKVPLYLYVLYNRYVRKIYREQNCKLLL